jgi:Zn finger protein HypA/HybF involved in hydrogenase expression
VKYSKGLVFLLIVALFPITAIAENSVESGPEFNVLSRQDKFEYFPCDSCHQYMETDPTPRRLPEAPHFPELKHGNADIWCTTCHTLEKRERLRLFSGELVEFDKAYLVCGQCHNNAYQDWRFGAHGKRIKKWQGERQIYNCAECHNPHVNPGIQQRPPLSPPGVRAQQAPQHQKRAQFRHRNTWHGDTPSGSEASNVTQ